MSEGHFIPRTQEDLAHEFPPQLKYISASSLRMLVRCEEQWRQRYIAKQIIPPPALNLTLGTADHAAIEHSMRQKIDTHVDLPVNEVQQKFLEVLEGEVESKGGIAQFEVKDAETTRQKRRVYDAERKVGPQVVSIYHRGVSPRYQPLTVEEQFEVEVPGIPAILTGYIDLTADHADALFVDSPVIIDRKRTGRGYNKVDPEWSLQAEVYQYVKPLPFEWHLSVTTKNPYCKTDLRQEPPPHDRVLMMLRQQVLRIGWLYQRFGPDEPWPATGKMHTWACSYCGYRDDCWGWKD